MNSTQKMDSTPKEHTGQILVGASIAFIALFFPLFTVTYNPPGGSAIVAGHRIPAFVDVISGWQFADTAAYFRLLPAIICLFSFTGLRMFISLVFPHKAITKTVVDYLHAFMYTIIACGWLLVLFLAIIIGTPAMPVSGEAGILPAFQIPPYAPNQPVTVEVPHLSASIGIGYFLLLLGIAIGGLAVFKKVLSIGIALLALLLIFYYADREIFQLLVQFLGI